MFQPKPRTGTSLVNRLLTWIISGAVVIAGSVTPALAASPTPVPTPTAIGDPVGAVGSTASPSATPNPIASGEPTPTVTPTPTPTSTPTPTETPPVLCGVCFNPGAYSLIKANSLWVVANKQRPLDPINYVPKNLVQPAFANPSRSNPYRLRVAKPAADALVQMTVGGQGLAEGDLAPGLVKAGHVGEGAADVDGDAQPGLGLCHGVRGLRRRCRWC